MKFNCSSVLISMEILGKTNIHFKVCSAPKRDMARDEKEMEKLRTNKRPMSTDIAAVGKRPSKMIKLEPRENIKIERNEMKSDDGGESSIPSPKENNEEEIDNNKDESVTITFTMPTRDSMAYVLRCARNEIFGLCARNKTKDPTQYFKYARKIEKLMGKCWYLINDICFLNM